MAPSLVTGKSFFLYQAFPNVLLIISCVIAEVVAFLPPLGTALKLIKDSVKFWNTGKKDITCISAAL